MAFAPVFPRVFPATFDRRAAAAAAASWWLAGGVAAANAIAVYQPKGAASLAASYTNLANPGTYDAAPGVAPTFDAATGWTFNGTSQYLTTGVTPASGWSLIVRFSDATTNNGIVAGALGSLDSRLYIRHNESSFVRYGGGGSVTVAPELNSGVLAVSGQQGYRNGSADGGAISAWSGTSIKMVIGALNSTAGGGVVFYTNAKIQAVAIYNTTLSAAQVASISAAMAAL